MTKRYLLLLTWLAVGGLPSQSLAQKVGPEFQVNTYTRYTQGYQSVASDATGNFVVVWQSTFQDGSSDGVFGQRYRVDGSRAGDEFQVNTFTFSGQYHPSVAADASGNFVVVWASDYGDGSGLGIFGQRYRRNGTRIGDEFQVNTYTTFNQGYPSIASDSSGNFVVVWHGDGQGDVGYGVFGQRYDSSGNPLGGEFRVNTHRINSQRSPSVASDATGNFVVVWQSYPQDGSGYGIFGQRYDSSGTALGGEFQVNTYTANSQRYPSVASDASGNFVVVWHGDGQGDGDYGVFGQRYDSDGNTLGSEFQVNTYTTSFQLFPSVASDASGTFIVVWQTYADGSDWGVFGQRYDSDGNGLGGEFRVNTETVGTQFRPSVASDASGDFVVVWTSNGQDGNDFGVFGQRFCKSTTCTVP